MYIEYIQILKENETVRQKVNIGVIWNKIQNSKRKNKQGTALKPVLYLDIRYKQLT